MIASLPVIVCGAGPVGLTAALYLARRGIDVEVLERNTEIVEDPRAATFHPPTLELFEETGVTDELQARGIRTPVWQFRDRRDGLIAEFDLGVLRDVTRFPYRLQCEQHKLVRILTEKLKAFPNCRVHFGIDVEHVEQKADQVEIVDKAGARHRGLYVIGADGGRSVVRKSQNIDFPGFTYEERFLVITTLFDFASVGMAFSTYLSDPQEWAALFKVPAKGPPGHWRVVFPVGVNEPEDVLLSHENARKKLRAFLLRGDDFAIVHTNLYQVHQRVAAQFRKGRVLLAGDAAHVNNPLGGMGMNFGIHDAINGAEKIAGVLQGNADEAVLERYHRQRHRVANDFLQAMTIQNKKLLEERDPLARAAAQAELREIAQDRDRMRAYLLRTSMIEGVRAAAAIG